MWPSDSIGRGSWNAGEGDQHSPVTGLVHIRARSWAALEIYPVPARTGDQYETSHGPKRSSRDLRFLRARPPARCRGRPVRHRCGGSRPGGGQLALGVTTGLAPSPHLVVVVPDFRMLGEFVDGRTRCSTAALRTHRESADHRARPGAVRLVGRVLGHPHLHLLAGGVQQRLGGPARGRALWLAEPDRGRLHAVADAHRPPGGLGGGLCSDRAASRSTI
jgi:hypothetical protein